MAASSNCPLSTDLPASVLKYLYLRERSCSDAIMLQDFELAGYNLFSYSRQTRQGGGVFVYVNSLHSATLVSDPSEDDLVESIGMA